MAAVVAREPISPARKGKSSEMMSLSSLFMLVCLLYSFSAKGCYNSRIGN